MSEGGAEVAGAGEVPAEAEAPPPETGADRYRREGREKDAANRAAGKIVAPAGGSFDAHEQARQERIAARRQAEADEAARRIAAGKRRGPVGKI